MEGITLEVMKQALLQAKAGRQHILREMQACDPPPAKQLSKYAARIRRFKVDPEKIGAVIGSGGRNIRMLTAAAGCQSITVSPLDCCLMSWSFHSLENNAYLLLSLLIYASWLGSKAVLCA